MSVRPLSIFVEAIDRWRLGLKDRTFCWLRRLCLGAGLLTVLGLPPVDLWPVGFIGFPLLLWALDGAASPRKAFWLGWVWGFGYFLAGLYWISNAFGVDPQKLAWLVPAAAVVLPAGLAFFIAVPAYLYKKLSGPQAAWRVVLLASLLTLFEVLRGTLFTGFPWNLTAYLWSSSAVMLQTASLVGAYGLSFVSLLIFLFPVWLVQEKGGDLLRWRATYTSLLLAAGMIVFGAVRLMTPLPAPSQTVEVRLIQANIPQIEKYKGLNKQEHIEAHLRLSSAPRDVPYDLLIWPETAVGYPLNQYPELRTRVTSGMPDHAVLMTGSVRTRYDEAGRLADIWNSAFVLAADGKILDTYDKSTLVPFGEYIPLSDILPLEKITGGGGKGFSAGKGVQSVSFGAHLPLTASPLICYEAIFPGRVTGANEAPDLLINLTNDAWYGVSSGPYQHAQISRLRAIEAGRPLIRVANSGISAIYDAYGNTKGATHIYTQDVMDKTVKISKMSTLYTLLGSMWVVLMAAMLGLLAIIYRRV